DIPSYGSPDWNRGSVLWPYHFRWCAETRQYLMDGLDQRWKLIGRYLVPSHIRGDNFRREFPIGRAGRLLVRHRLALPFRVSRNIPYPKVSRRRSLREGFTNLKRTTKHSAAPHAQRRS